MEELGFINKHKNTAYETMGEFYSKLTEELDAALDDEHSDRYCSITRSISYFGPVI